jgi:hypothetical protein
MIVQRTVYPWDKHMTKQLVVCLTLRDIINIIRGKELSVTNYKQNETLTIKRNASTE